ncbi:MAG TPA: UMP kinase [archaeon]|nr:UMP kinase [archaeon]
MKVVVKFSGFFFPSELEVKNIETYANLFKKLHRAGHRILIVTGGGENARKYIKVARALGADEALCDQLGIEVTRLNARLLISKLGEEAYPEPPKSIDELKHALITCKIVIMGGLTPGHSTDAVAAIAAELMGANVLIRTLDVDGVYTADPKINPDAKRLSKITPMEMLELVMSGKCWAGGYALLDPVAIKIIERSHIPTWILNGKDPHNIEKIIKGKKVGTLVMKEQ